MGQVQGGIAGGLVLHTLASGAPSEIIVECKRTLKDKEKKV